MHVVLAMRATSAAGAWALPLRAALLLACCSGRCTSEADPPHVSYGVLRPGALLSSIEKTKMIEVPEAEDPLDDEFAVSLKRQLAATKLLLDVPGYDADAFLAALGGGGGGEGTDAKAQADAGADAGGAGEAREKRCAPAS